MFAKNAPKNVELQSAIDKAVIELDGYSAVDAEYSTIVDQLTKLEKIKNDTRPDRISKDALAMVAGNLLGIALIVGFEQSHVMTSKALNFIGKFK